MGTMADKTQKIDPEILIALIDRLNSYPVGLPDSPEIREFLSVFLTEDEAFLASKFPLREATAEEMAKKVCWDIDKTKKLLEGMANKGAVIDFYLGGQTFWLLTPSVIGFIEFSLMKMHEGVPMKRLAQILRVYEENDLWKEVFGSKTRIARTVVEPDIPVRSEVATYAMVEDIVRQHGYGAFQTCFCRHKAHLLDQDCKKAGYAETCISLGQAADFVLRRGFGRRAEADEILARVKELGKKGLIHITDNVRDKPSFICNCCGCCCGLLYGITSKGIKHSVAPSPYILEIDQDKCIGCGLCAKRCQISAITIKDKKSYVDKTNCLGCGACTLACEQQALTLIKRKRQHKIPKNFKTKLIRIAYEKDRLFPIIKAALEGKIRKFL